MKSLICTLIAISGLFLMSCERAEKEVSSTLRFRMPETSESLSAQKLSGADPGTIGDINCYGVFVSGPEDAMKSNRCYKEESPAATVFPVGVVRAGIPAGQEISLDVPPGADRTIKLIGFRTSTGACYDWFAAGAQMIENEVSKPYILSEVTGIDLQPGAVKEVPMTLAFNSNNWIDKCTGPTFDSNSGGGGTKVTPTQISLRKASFPAEYIRKTTASGVSWACEEFEAYASDVNGNNGYFDSSTPTFAVGISATATTPAVTFFNSYAACSANSAPGLITSLTFSGGNSNQRFYVRTDNFSESNVALTLTPSLASLVSSTKTYTADQYYAKTFTVDMPDKMVPGGCYAVKMNRQTFEGVLSAGSATSFSISPDSASLTTYSDTGCTTSSSTASASSSAVFYFKISPGTNTQVGFTLSGDTGALSITRKIGIAAGDLTPVGLKVVAWNTFPVGSCGPDSRIKSVLVNSMDSAIPAPAGGVNFLINYAASDTLKVSCGGGTYSSGTEVSMTAGNSSYILYLQAGAAASSNAFEIVPTSPGTSLKRSVFNYRIY